jgi:hypothetical protein
VTDVSTSEWLGLLGLGGIWLGVQIVVVAGLPRRFRSAPVPKADRGSPAAFQLFWLDQYSYIGLALTAVGMWLAVWGLLA